MEQNGKILTTIKDINVRFSEVDAMNIVWHGNYAKYFEDAREAFGNQYNIDYLTMYNNGFYAPLVDLSFKYKSPIFYGHKVRIEITFRNSNAAKIVFDYIITNLTTNQIACTGSSTQVFMDLEYNLQWTNPDFFVEWKRKMGLTY